MWIHKQRALNLILHFTLIIYLTSNTLEDIFFNGAV